MMLRYWPLYQLYALQGLPVTYSTVNCSPGGSVRCASVRDRHASIAARKTASTFAGGMTYRLRKASYRSASDPDPGSNRSSGAMICENSTSVLCGGLTSYSSFASSSNEYFSSASIV